MDQKCIVCGRAFCKDIHDNTKECLRHLPVFTFVGESVDYLGLICQDCHHERTRENRIRSRMFRETKTEKEES